MIFTDANELLARINADAPAWRLIAIDGWLGAGKTKLGRELSRIGKMWALDLDSFMLLRIDAFVSALNWPGLIAAINATDARIVMSGVCAREILERLGLKADSHVYVKRMSSGYWADEDEAVGDGVEALARAAGAPPSAARAEVHRYHQNYAPHLSADYEYHDHGE